MRISVDIDGVLTDYSGFIDKYGKKFFKKKDEDIDKSTLDIAKRFNVSDERVNKFWTRYVVKYCLKEPFRKDMVSSLNKLTEAGHEIYLNTSRVHTTRNDFLGGLFRNMLYRQIKRSGLVYKGIGYCKTPDDKKENCIKFNADYHIDDEIDNLNEVSKVCNAICFSNTYNKDLQGVVRISGGNELLRLIKEVDSNLKGSVHVERDRFKYRYGLARTIGVPYFKSKYNPEIVGKENIPKEGPIILCGNHLHVLDQFPVICATKRVTHWMAKKEYFEGKQATFFKQTGAIPVDRKGDAKQAERIAIDYLNKGSAIGIFPEGTRNSFKRENYRELYEIFDSLKSETDFEIFSEFLHKMHFRQSEIDKLIDLYHKDRIDRQTLRQTLLHSDGDALEYLFNRDIISKEEYEDAMLLPFKMGAVNMAKKTGALLVPFSVTGDYDKKRNNLIVSFDKPMDVTNMSYEDANRELRSKVLKLMLNNRK